MDETGNKWYQYKSTTSATSVTGTNNGSSVSLGNIYVKYDTSAEQLIVLANTSSTDTTGFYAKYSKDVTSSTWVGGVAAAIAAEKITRYSGDPTENRIELTGEVNWGELAADKIVNLLLGE